MKKTATLLCLIAVFQVAHAPTIEAQILASPVIDVANNAVGAIGKVVAQTARAIREDILPWKERISKVQDFFRQASEKVNVVVTNFAMVNDLIEMENKINRLFDRSIQGLDQAENFEEKWKYRVMIHEVYRESLSLFNVFDIAQYEQGTMDDENRIILIRETLKKARRVYTSLRVAVRRVNKAFADVARTKKELEVFERFFGDPE